VVIDSHIHFWDQGLRDYEWLRALPQLPRRFAPTDIAPGAARLSGVVFVEADCRAEAALDEVRWVASLAAEPLPVLGIVGHAPLHLGSRAAVALERLAAEPLVVGVRRLLQGEPPAVLADSELRAGIRQLAAHNLAFDLCITHDQLRAAHDLVAECPETTVVLDHLGKPPVATGADRPWREDIVRLARLPNVACKLSGLMTEASPGWRFDDLRPYVRHALEVFGPQRCMFGSDWPVGRLGGQSLAAWVEFVEEQLETLSGAERRLVMAETAVATYGLHLEPRLRGDGPVVP
jgi:L-fuconolactonase